MKPEATTNAELATKIGTIATAVERLLVVVEAWSRQSPLQPKPYLSVAETAELFGVSTKTIHRAVCEGRLKSTRLGRRVFFTRADIDEYIRRSAEVDHS